MKRFSLAVVYLSLAFFAGTARAATISVLNTADAGAGSLRAAIASASDGDTIDATGVSGTITLTTGELSLPASVTILGPGPSALSVNGNATFRVFSIAPDVTVSMTGLMVTNGLAPLSEFLGVEVGGGIYNEGGTLTLSNCVVAGNSSTFGAGIFNDAITDGSASLTIIDSVVSANTSSSDGGGILSLGFDGIAELTARNVTFTGNAGDHGGGIEGDGDVMITDCTFAHNSAASSGGAVDVFVDVDIVQLQIVHSTFTNNVAGFAGGAISVEAVDGFATLLLSNSTVSANQAELGGGINLAKSEDAQIGNSSIVGNSVTDSGGGIYNDRSVLTLSASTINNNDGALNGGGIFNSAQDFDASVDMVNCTVSGNFAASGDGILNLGSGGGFAYMSIIHSTVHDDSIVNDASGADHLTGDAAMDLGHTILDSGLSGASIENFDGVVGSFGYNLASDDTGGVLTDPTDIFNTDPLLQPLADNGGPTFTHALPPESPARNAGDPAFAPPPQFDQRGFARVVAGRIDIGSYEIGSDVNTEPVAVCTDVIVDAGSDCTAEASVDDGSFDPDGDQINVTQTPAGPYSLGTTPVILMVTDGRGGTNSCSANVTVVNPRPNVECAGNQSALATSPEGAFVFYPDPDITGGCGATITAEPESGSLFPNGDTTVTITISSPGGTDSCSFSVHVKSAIEQIEDALASLDDLNLDPGIARELSNQLTKIGLRIAHRHDKQACRKLDRFLKHVEKLRSRARLSTSQSETLSDTASNIRTALGCGGD